MHLLILLQGPNTGWQDAHLIDWSLTICPLPCFKRGWSLHFEKEVNRKLTALKLKTAILKQREHAAALITAIHACCGCDASQHTPFYNMSLHHVSVAIHAI